ncbi:amidohydrolase family protein [Pseudonocardia spinosispora]|uniref:amidohydrolase family protein n=1 Tax=Pseudonocardia spinosispora TaxID=103441 RepID=UPI00040D1201|nr:amidohydrolase family protein [Pseudonocardia spinosispora]
MRTITLEEHHASPGYLDAIAPHLKRDVDLADKLGDIGERRIAAMDEAGIDVQILSLGPPGVEQLDAETAVAIARQENDHRGQAVRRYPDRFAGFATVPTAAPVDAANELTRTREEYGFVGVLINGHTRGRYLDDTHFWPILEQAEKLGMPVYLHPMPPPQAVIDASYSGFAPEVTARLSSWAWGWHIDTAVHVLRMIVGGVFDRYPELQVVIGHLGEGLVSMMPRVETSLTSDVTGLKRPVGAYLRENLYYTTSGFNYSSVFLDLVLQVGVERIMFSADYPYWTMGASQDFLDRVPLSPNDKEAIAHGTAERLFRMGGTKNNP